MLRNRKICIVTGTRAEFGLLNCLIEEAHNSKEIELQLVVTGMHLSPEFGLTEKHILEKGYPITKKVETLVSSDTSVGISKSMGLGMISFGEVFNELQPDIIVVLGDRFEIFSAVSAAMIGNFPIAHIHGGESTEGVIDEAIRHSITKMSHIHFTATSEYKSRVIQLGECPNRVFNTGTPGLDNIRQIELLNRTDLEKSINFQLGAKSALVTFHPVTLETNTSEKQFKELLRALDSINDLKIIFTKPNSDTGGRVIINLIDEYVLKNPERACSFISLGQQRYLSALNLVNVVIGNSSSGIIEAPTLKTPTVNIGDRQKGRQKAESIIDCKPITKEILKSIELSLSDNFKDRIMNVKNPYGNYGASKRIFNILKTFPLEGILKKKFYDLPIRIDT